MKVDSAVTDVGWGAGGGLYSSLSFLFVCFRDLRLRKPSVFFLRPLARLASNSPIARFSELIFLILLHIADFLYR